jgi:hypothetical protein
VLVQENVNFGAASQTGDQRRSERIRVTGWANFLIDGLPVKKGRLFDLSTEGVSIFLDDQLARRQLVELAFGGFRNGRRIQLRVQADCQYATLVGSNGVRHGFHFQEFLQGSPSDITEFLA